MAKRQINFYIEKELWREFTKKCVDLDKTKTDILIEFIEKFLGKKK